MRALTRGVDEHRTRAVDHVSGGHLPPPGLQHVLHLAAAPARDLPDNGKNRSDRDVDIDVR